MNQEQKQLTPTTKNPLTGEKVGEGEPTEKITKQPVDEIVHYGGEKYLKAIKMNLIQMQGSKKKTFQVNQELKS